MVYGATILMSESDNLGSILLIIILQSIFYILRCSYLTSIEQERQTDTNYACRKLFD